jgi:hypothetical protein
MTIFSNNGLPNGGFLMGTSGWGAASGNVPTLAVAETGVGAIGRAVLSVSRTAEPAGAWIISGAPRLAVPAGARIVECQARAAAQTSRLSIGVAWYQGATFQSATFSPATVSAGMAPPVGGLDMVDVWFTAQAPAGVDGAALIVAALDAGVVQHWISRPALFAHDVAPAIRTRFDPGVHAQTDLQLAVWPRALSPFFSDNVSWAPRETRMGFDADNGAMRDRRVVARPRRQADFTLRCTPAQRDLLVAFECSQHDRDFWMVDPVDDTLCRARFRRDGAPRLVGHQGYTQLWSVGLETRIA